MEEIQRTITNESFTKEAQGLIKGHYEKMG
jgi:hypothetical protein